jgi:hypothetical protein
MQYAITGAGGHEAPTKGARGTCPTCGEDVIAKCGTFVAWHWAHTSGAECDPWAEHAGPWHKRWKSLVRPGATEITIGKHRADIVGNAGRVIELQHSPVSPEEIRAREEFYKRMVWLFDASEFDLSCVQLERLSTSRPTPTPKGLDYIHFRATFTWKRARKGILTANKPLFFDLGESAAPEQRIFHVTHVTENTLKGRLYAVDWFISRYFSAVGGVYSAEVMTSYMTKVRGCRERLRARRQAEADQLKAEQDTARAERARKVDADAQLDRELWAIVRRFVRPQPTSKPVAGPSTRAELELSEEELTAMLA